MTPNSAPNAPISGVAISAKGVFAIALFIAPFLLPWWFVAPPHGTRFYELVAQIFPILVIVWLIELRGTASHSAAPTLVIRRLGPWADAAMATLGEGVALYAAGYGVSDSMTFALTAGPLAFFGARVFLRSASALRL